MTDKTEAGDPVAPGGPEENVGEQAAADEDLADLLASGPDMSLPSRGDIVRGKLVQITETDALVALGGKSDAVIAREELLGKDGAPAFKIGDTIEARVVSTDGILRLSRQTISSLMSKEEVREMLAEAARKKLPVRGRVTASVKGGYEVMVGGVRGFCPFSQIDLRHQEDPLLYFNKTFDFQVKEFRPRRGNLILSRRVLIEREAKKKEAAFRASLTAGSVHEGKVVSLQDFGAFVDLGSGVQGLVHVSEISHARVEHPKDALSVGQPVRVQVLKHDKKKGKISLTLKALEADPWDGIADLFHVGQVLASKVTRVTEFGAFLEITPGVDGLLHVSEMQGLSSPASRRTGAENLIQPGQELKVQVLKVDARRRRVSLGLADESSMPGDIVEMSRLRVKSIVTGKVERLEKFGVFLRIGPGRIGLIPNNELPMPRGADRAKLFPVGTELTAEIIEADPAGRKIRLSVSRARDREEREALQRYKQDKTKSGGSLSTLADAFAAFRKSKEPG
ncbi:MAG: S1 RNA-binding domain-containing protein [Acidobacteriota bacterium]